MDKIITEDISGAEVGGLLVGLRVKGETVEEISGFVDTMQKHMVYVDLVDKNAIDVCGTGGDGRHSFNVSTTCALVAAAGGVTVAKHGNRSVSSKSGSADLLEALGVKIDIPPEKTKKSIDEIGIGFFFAPNYHPAMKAVVPHRKSLGIRTAFNILGPLLNPARVKRQLIGLLTCKPQKNWLVFYNHKNMKKPVQYIVKMAMMNFLHFPQIMFLKLIIKPIILVSLLIILRIGLRMLSTN